MEEIDLKEFLKYLRKYVWMMLVAVAILVGAISFYDLSVKVPMHKSHTTVVLNKSDSKSSTAQEDLTSLNLNQKLISTYSEIVKSSNTLERVVADLYPEITDADEIQAKVKELSGKITVSTTENTELMIIYAENADANEAARISDSTASAFKAVIKDIYEMDNIKILDTAKASDAVSNNTFSRDVVIAAMLGIFGVTAIAFLIFYFDDSVKYSKNLERELGIPVIGKIARCEIEPNKRSIGNELAVVKMPKSSTSEAIRNLRTNLSFSAVDKGLKSILITSTNPAEGKSFISCNLATAYAQAGYRVLLVDADLRKGRLHRVFGLKNRNGFSNMLIDNEYRDLDKFIKATDYDLLNVITRGTCPPNPSELLGSERAGKIAKALRRKFDIVIFDGAPCVGLSDSIVASSLVDKVLIVCSDGKTNRSDLMSVYEDLQKVNAPIAGIVVNNIKGKDAGYYNYYEKDIYKYRDAKFEAALIKEGLESAADIDTRAKRGAAVYKDAAQARNIANEKKAAAKTVAHKKTEAEEKTVVEEKTEAEEKGADEA